VTRWQDGVELYVEMSAPAPGQGLRYRAHVTRVDDALPVSSGVLQLRFEQDGFAVESHADTSVVSPGLFASEAPVPSKPGRYQLIFSYVGENDRVEWGEVRVQLSAAGGEVDAEAVGEIAVSKEVQWQVGLQVAPASERRMSPTLNLGATVVAAPGTTAVIAAPVEGLLAWSDALPVVGREVRQGEHLAALIPAGAAEPWARLQADLATARVDHGLAQKELARVEGLAERELLSERRLEEARASVVRAESELAATRRRVSALSSGNSGAVPIRAPADGYIVSVGASHGTAVSAGMPLVSVSSGDAVLIEGHVHDRSQTALGELATLSVMRGDWTAPRDLLPAGGLLLTERLVFDAHTLSAPISVLVEDDIGLVPGDIVELQVGVGVPEPRLAVPRAAVVEINGQDVIFVQKSGESFTRRRVGIGTADPTHVEILSGLSLGERVVVDGGFDVHVASVAGALESHKH